MSSVPASEEQSKPALKYDPRFTSPIIQGAQISHQAFFPLGPYASVSLAQWADESGFGVHLSGKHNPFGIKATPAQIAAGKASVCWTLEFFGGMYHKVQQYFADYDDDNAAFYEHARLLATSPIYQDAQRASNVNDYVVAMAKRYASEPHYAQILLSIIRENNLEQFDS